MLDLEYLKVCYCIHREDKATTELSTWFHPNQPLWLQDPEIAFSGFWFLLAEKTHDSNTHHDTVPNNLTKKYTVDIAHTYFNHFALELDMDIQAPMDRNPPTLTGKASI